MGNINCIIKKIIGCFWNWIKNYRYQKDESPIPKEINPKFTIDDELNFFGMVKQQRSHEDRYIIDKIDDVSYFGVFDGHGCHSYPSFELPTDHMVVLTRKYLHQHLKEALEHVNLNDKEKVTEIIKDTFLNFDRIHYESASHGTTASIVLLTDSLIYQVNLGDSKSIVFTTELGGHIVSETKDHSLTVTNDEPERIKSAGGYVQYNRVLGMLAVTRSFGDFEFKTKNGLYPDNPVVSAVPDVTVINRQPGQYLLLGSDGLFTQESKYIIKLLSDKLNSGSSLDECVKETVDTTSILTDDDISMILVAL